MSLLIHVPSYHGRESLILGCDDDALKWLCGGFAALALEDVAQAGFAIGDGRPIKSDHGVEIRFLPAQAAQSNHIVQR